MLYKTRVGIHRRKYVDMNAKIKRELAEETQNAITKRESTFKAIKCRIEMLFYHIILYFLITNEVGGFLSHWTSLYNLAKINIYSNKLALIIYHMPVTK